MSCCSRCGAVYRWSYELCGDGDGIEFLIETAHLFDGERTTTTIVFSPTRAEEPW
jgi:hypothetical protein